MATPLKLPKGISGLSSMPKTQEMLCNLYWTDAGIMRTPGIDFVLNAPTDRLRGAGLWYLDSCAYFVIGAALYRLESSMSLTEIGPIAGISDCVFSSGHTTLVIIAQGGAGYTYDATAGLVPITDPDFIPCDSVDFMDGRHVFIPSDGSPAIYSEIDLSGAINPLSFFDAEELPDTNRVCINISNQLYIGGGQSFEIYKSTGDNTAPFGRREGARVDVGYVGGIVRYKNTFAFIGHRRDQGFTICAMTSGDVVDLSTPAIAEIINSLTLAQLSAATVDTFEWNQTTFIVWTVGELSLCFVDGQWIYLDSDLNGSEDGPWRARGVVFAHGRYYVGDRTTGSIGRLSDGSAEYGENVEYWLQSFGRMPRNSYPSVRSLEIDALTGLGAETVGLSVSRDGRNWSGFYYRDLGDVGEYQRRIVWAGGLGRYESFMGYRLRGTGQVKFSLEGAQIEL